MNTLILFSSKKGTTEKCAKELSKKLSGNVEILNLKKRPKIDFSKYDSVILGASYYIGQIRKDMKKFSTEHIDTLKEKRLGLFICCGAPSEEAQKELTTGYPAELIGTAVAKEAFGGEYLFENMNLFERWIIKKVAKIEKSTSSISYEAIDRFANVMNQG